MNVLNKPDFKTIGIVSKPLKEKASEVISNLIAWLKERGKTAILDEDTKALLDDYDGKHTRKSDIPSNCDLVIVLGGDGTFLSVARLLVKTDIPILGINLGSLGFLTETTLTNMYKVIDDVFKGNFEIDNRMVLRTHVHRQGERIAEYNALNDVVINNGALARIITMSTFIDNKFVTRYRADGLIVSTPTGSTAYSLAAGGPIVYPNLDVITISPICPHTLGNRPIVIPGSSIIEVTLETKTEDVLLTLDGQVGFTLRSKDVVEIKKSEKPIRIIQSRERNYFETLRTKLGWGNSEKNH
ncbi:MAG: NAD(+) kinase [Candidatus Schekmanbacteria bacterium]|nr:MAG: NAD(+) kinase [Candidatus Schekmanbacteria bacterium]